MSQTPIIAPKLRGWFHLGATPAVIIASLVLFILSKESLKFAVAIYSLTAIMLFSVSAIYHRVPWVPSKNSNVKFPPLVVFENVNASVSLSKTTASTFEIGGCNLISKSFARTSPFE